jgi:hypothetical protein
LAKGADDRTVNRLVRAIRRVWAALPEDDRVALSRLWKSADTAFVVAAADPPQMLGKCVPEAACLLFSASHVARLPDWLVQTLVAHEMSHGYLFSQAGSVGTEEEADAVTSRWGFAMSTARRAVDRGGR